MISKSRVDVLFKSKLKLLYHANNRNLFSETGRWPITCAFEPWCIVHYLKSVEKHWKPILRKEWTKKLACCNPSDDNHRFILSMFPYPSGSLHLGKY